jgi:Flp pilus assembly protein TadD
MTQAQAMAAFSAKQYQEALMLAENLLAGSPDNLEVLNIAAISAAMLEQAQQAEQLWKRSLALQPDNIQSLSNLGVLLITAKRYVEAEACLRRALALKTDYADTHIKLAHLLEETGRLSDAESSLRHAVKLQSGDTDLLLRWGRVLKQLQRLDEAKACFEQVLQVKPDDAMAHFNLANLLCEQEKYIDGEKHLRAALAAKPDYAEAWGNLGVVLRTTKKYDKAETAYLKALSINPNDPQVNGNLGYLYVLLKRFDDAERCYRHSIFLSPNIEVICNLSYVLLLRQFFDEGWRCYEARYDKRNPRPSCGVPNLPYPQWRGEDVKGKKIMLWHEQGYGDIVQFSRYAAVFKQKGAALVTFVCDAPLRDLLQTLKDADQIVSPEEAMKLSAHDYWTLLFSTPIYYKMAVGTIPADIPYLSALPDRIAKWATRLPKDKFKIGLVWKANANHKSSLERSLPGLHTLRDLWRVKDVFFVSLQKGDGEAEGLNPPAQQPLLHLGTEIEDFADTAAIVSQLDLVITVDTAVVHIAGALGKPVWVMLPFIADWRWMLDREDSPWYPTATLFRQSQEGVWSDVTDRIFGALKRHVALSAKGTPGKRALEQTASDKAVSGKVSKKPIKSKSAS